VVEVTNHGSLQVVERQVRLKVDQMACEYTGDKIMAIYSMFVGPSGKT